MSFQNPLMLAGLAAIVLPVLLHLIGRATARPRPWGAMMFLGPAHASLLQGSSRQTLLLLCRTGALIALVLAFARPVRSTGSAAGTELVIVVDTSASMGLFDSGLSRLDRAKAAALQALSTLRPGDTAAVVTAESTVRSTTDLQSIAAKIEQLSASRQTGTMSFALRSADELLAGSMPRSAQECVIGDLGAVRWPAAPAAAKRASVVTIDVGSKGANDMVLQHLNVGAPNRPAVADTVEVRNTAVVRRDVVVRWAVDQSSAGESKLSVPARGVAVARMSTRQLTAGSHLLSASLADSVPSTNPELIEVVNVTPPPRMLVVGDAAPVIAAALRFPDVRVVARLADTDLNGRDVLLLCGDAWPPPASLSMLDDFVGGGGRLLILPGDGFDLAGVEADLDSLDMLPADSIAAVAVKNSSLRLPGVAKPIPVRRELRWKGFSRNAREFLPAPGSSAAALSMPVERGVISIASTGLGDAWSDLIDSSALSPWMRSLVDDILPPVSVDAPINPGSSMSMTVPAPVDAHSAVVETPDAETDGVFVNRSHDICELRYPQIQLAGAYRLSYRSNGRPHVHYFIVAATNPKPIVGSIGPPTQAIAAASVEQLPRLLRAGRPTTFDGFGPVIAIALLLLGLSMVLESPTLGRRA